MTRLNPTNGLPPAQGLYHPAHEHDACGIGFVASSRTRSIRGMRMLGLMMVLGFSTLWLGSCGGSSSGPKDPGTPTGSYSITVKGTSGSLTRQTTFQLVVVQ